MQVDTFNDLKRSTIIYRLKQYDYTDVEGKSDKELLHILTYLKADRVDISSDANKFF